MGWRQAIDDLRRAHFVLGFGIAVGVAIWAGTYWGWWAYMWDIALPVRVVGVLAISATAFFLWYALLFSAHHYLGVPKRNPLIGPRLQSDVETPNLSLRLHGRWEDETYRIAVSNEGDTDVFAVETSWMQGAHEYPPLPSMMRWRGVGAEKREIIKGHTSQLEVCRYERATTGMPLGELPLAHLWLLTPGAEVDLLGTPHRYVELYVSFKVTSATTGKRDGFSLKLVVVSTGMVQTSAALSREDSGVFSL